jgi:hypothetical protein
VRKKRTVALFNPDLQLWCLLHDLDVGRKILNFGEVGIRAVYCCRSDCGSATKLRTQAHAPSLELSANLGSDEFDPNFIRRPGKDLSKMSAFSVSGDKDRRTISAYFEVGKIWLSKLGLLDRATLEKAATRNTS